jgi:hypothetical protein
MLQAAVRNGLANQAFGQVKGTSVRVCVCAYVRTCKKEIKIGRNEWK